VAGLIQKIIRAYGMLKIASNSLGGMQDLPTLSNLEDHLAQFDATALGLINASALDIGCGADPKNPFKAKNVFGLDIRENVDANIKYADLTLEPIPFPSDTFDYITAYDFLEHVPRVIYTPQRRFPFVALMNEIWRTLKPNGIFLSHTPIYPYSAAFRDPTHVNILSHDTFTLYFDNKIKWAGMYGFAGSFEVLHQGLIAPHLVSVLRKEG
jgi:SAM-dependent methyltransferase